MDGLAGLIQLNHGQMIIFLLLSVLNMLHTDYCCSFMERAYYLTSWNLMSSIVHCEQRSAAVPSIEADLSLISDQN
jgi:hypothetical protein